MVNDKFQPGARACDAGGGYPPSELQDRKGT